MADKLSEGHSYALLSSHDSKAVADFKKALLQEVRSEQVLEVFVPYSASQVNVLIYSKCRILENSVQEQGIQFKIEATAHVLKQIVEELKEVRQ